MLVDSASYKLLLLLHITAIVIAFAPLVVYPMLGRQLAADDPGVRGRIAGFAAQNGKSIHSPALGLAGLFGIGLVFSSDDVWEFEDVWVTAAIVIWFLLNGVYGGMILPAQRKVAGGDASAARIAQTGQALMSVGFVVLLYLMIWKP